MLQVCFDQVCRTDLSHLISIVTSVARQGKKAVYKPKERKSEQLKAASPALGRPSSTLSFVNL